MTTKTTPYKTTISKMVTDRQKAAAELAAVLESHAEEAQEALAAVIEPYLDEGEAAPDLFVLQKALRRRLVELDRDLVRADDQTLQERLEDREVRRERNDAVAELAHRLSRLRAGVEAAYGPGSAAELVVIEGPIPRDPVVLHRLGLRVVERLREDPFAGYPSQLQGIVLDAAAWLPDLEGPLARLGAALEELVLEERDSISSVIRKRQAMKTYDEAYLTLARAFENLFRHVGLGELSQTVRPRRRSRLHQVEEQPEDVSQSEAGPQPKAVPQRWVPEPVPRAETPVGPTDLAEEPWPELKILDGGRRVRGSPTG